MIRIAQESDLESIARLHSVSFENHFLPKLGNKLLARYYKEFISEENIFLVNVDELGEINGLVLGTPDSSIGISKFIRNNRYQLIIRIILLCLKFDKDTLKRLKNFVKNKLNLSLFRKKECKYDKHSPANTYKMSLLSICVSKKAKGTGVSKSLIEEFENRLLGKGYTRYTLTVYKNNSRAINFYNKIGMTVYKETESEYGYFKDLLIS